MIIDIFLWVVQFYRPVLKILQWSNSVTFLTAFLLTSLREPYWTGSIAPVTSYKATLETYFKSGFWLVNQKISLQRKRIARKKVNQNKNVWPKCHPPYECTFVIVKITSFVLNDDDRPAMQCFQLYHLAVAELLTLLRDEQVYASVCLRLRSLPTVGVIFRSTKHATRPVRYFLAGCVPAVWMWFPQLSHPVKS